MFLGYVVKYLELYSKCYMCVSEYDKKRLISLPENGRPFSRRGTQIKQKICFAIIKTRFYLKKFCVKFCVISHIYVVA